MRWVLLQAVDGGLLGSVAQLATIAGTLVLLLMLVALGVFLYRSTAGDGIEWPDEDAEESGVTRGGDDDEWDYY
jgi:hypothetical protein